MQFITNDLASTDSIIATTTTANTIVETGVLALYTRGPMESRDPWNYVDRASSLFAAW